MTSSQIGQVNLSFIILASLLLIAHSQTTASSTTLSSATTIEATSEIPENASAATTTTVSSEILLSSNEFVDFTETPTILFDGTSNENINGGNQTDINGSSSPEKDTIAIKPTDRNKQTEVNETTTVKSIEPVDETTATKIVSSDAANDDGEEVPNLEEEDEEEETQKQTFVPPQNVSQYMDYIEKLFHDLRHQITDLFEPHIPQLIRTSQMVQLSGSCSYDMLRMALALRQFEPWALRMIDSSGKVPEGIFEGSFTALGSYDECINTVFVSSGTTSHTIANVAGSNGAPVTQGKYCLVNVSPFLPPKPPTDRVERLFQEEANRRNYTKDDQFSRLSPMFYYMKFRIGICIPSTCIDSDLESISSALSSNLKLNITIPHCKVMQATPFTTHQLVGGFVFAIVFTFVLGATLVDCSRRKLRNFEGQDIVVLRVANEKDQLASGTTEVPAVVLRAGRREDLHCCQDNEDETGIRATSKSGFIGRLDKHWSWLSFSILTNYKLYFRQKFSATRRQSRANLSGIARDSSKNHLTEQVADKKQTGSTMIRCLNGIRVLSLCWVIIANSYITLDPRATKRLTKTREAPKDFLFQMVAQASLAIETFFFLSGVLMSMSFAKRLNPKESDDFKVMTPEELKPKRTLYALQWIHFYVHRYIRMTPATMLVIAFTMFAFRYGDGPLWFEATHKAHLSCSENWWRHLLHVANFIDTRQMCFIHFWYIAADMQLFLFAPILLFLLYHRRRLGYALAGFIGLLSVGSIFYTTYNRNLPPTLLFYNSDPESRREFGNSIMTKPLTHALPYMVGMLVGKWLSTHGNNSSITNPANKSVATLFGAIATAVALGEVFLPYKWNNSHLPTRFLAAVYAALFRLAWSLVLAYLVISCRHRKDTKKCRNDNGESETHWTHSMGGACNDDRYYPCYATNNKICQQQQQRQFNNTKLILDHWNMDPVQGQLKSKRKEVMCFCGTGGNLLNRFLSLNIFTHFSKLSFVAYLIHLPLMSVFISQTRGLFAFSHMLVIHLALSYLVMTFIFSFILVHIIEFPFITFERYLFEKLFYSTSGSSSSSTVSNNKNKTPNTKDRLQQGDNRHCKVDSLNISVRL